MHGELIEFNERLYRSLMAKDHLIVQMKQELIDLRGPVSVETHTTHIHKHTQTQTHKHIHVNTHKLGFNISVCMSSFKCCSASEDWEAEENLSASVEL